MIRIRSCLPEDEKTLFALVREFATSFPVDQRSFSVSFSQVLSSASMYLAVAQSSEAVVGYVLGTAHPTFYAGGHVAWVEEIMVKEGLRRKGVGRLLMKNFETWAKSRDCRLVALATRRAAEFYKCLGYTESATYFRKVIQDAQTFASRIT
ncbi:MAG: GNAT family N-acetyltransferase [Verrucomicrobia bacterium]|nr:GNAT family N-acetyltransferase [Verrucomicrobiota bacterium]